MNKRDEIEAERRRASEAALAGVVRDGEVIGTSGFARTLRAAGDRVGAHFSASDAGTEDGADVWGRRIGRALALVVAAYLVFDLVTTYVLQR